MVRVVLGILWTVVHLGRAIPWWKNNTESSELVKAGGELVIDSSSPDDGAERMVLIPGALQTRGGRTAGVIHSAPNYENYLEMKPALPIRSHSESASYGNYMKMRPRLPFEFHSASTDYGDYVELEPVESIGIQSAPTEYGSYMAMLPSVHVGFDAGRVGHGNHIEMKSSTLVEIDSGLDNHRNDVEVKPGISVEVDSANEGDEEKEPHTVEMHDGDTSLSGGLRRLLSRAVSIVSGANETKGRSPPEHNDSETHLPAANNAALSESGEDRPSSSSSAEEVGQLRDDMIWYIASPLSETQEINTSNGFKPNSRKRRRTRTLSNEICRIFGDCLIGCLDMVDRTGAACIERQRTAPTIPSSPPQQT